MVAIVNGTGLGIGAGILGQAVGQTQFGQQASNVYVNPANGNLVIEGVDASLASLGGDVTLTRSYNSDGALAGQQGWLIGTGTSVTLTSGALGQAGSTVV